jgi:ribosomal protein S18 acetylase RimI-like enzyme
VDTIRVWLEPEYDHGRTGAWMLDWPGAFCWGATRNAALARVTAAVNRFVEWLAEHGEGSATAGQVPLVAEVVDEVAAYRLDDGYEVNATFAADRRLVSKDDLEAALRHLDYARKDLISLTRQIDKIDSTDRDLPLEHRSADALADGASDGRTSDGVLRHVAGAETWFVSRLVPDARYEGPREDLDSYLAASRDFLVDNLSRLHAADPEAARTDGKGEEWTLAKLLRRAVYHSLDHLEELDRRLALADGRVERLDLRVNASVDVPTLLRLFATAGLDRADDPDELTARVLAGSTATVSAWDGSRLVGFARIISDEATNGYISTVAVAPRWQDRGVGTRLMRALMDGRDDLKLTLDARDGAEGFYERLGFERARSIFVRRRSRA